MALCYWTLAIASVIAGVLAAPTETPSLRVHSRMWLAFITVVIAVFGSTFYAAVSSVFTKLDGSRSQDGKESGDGGDLADAQGLPMSESVDGAQVEGTSMLSVGFKPRKAKSAEHHVTDTKEAAPSTIVDLVEEEEQDKEVVMVSEDAQLYHSLTSAIQALSSLEIKTAFRDADEDNSGTLDAEEVRAASEKVGMNPDGVYEALLMIVNGEGHQGAPITEEKVLRVASLLQEQKDDLGLKHVTVVAVGDEGVGKTSLLVRFAKSRNAFPKHVSAVEPRFSHTYAQAGATTQMTLIDTTANPLPPTLMQADVFLVMFSVVDPASFNSVKSKWLPQKLAAQGKPIVLVGTKSDQAVFGHNHLPKVSDAQAQQLVAANPNVKEYVKCSAFDMSHVDKVFQKAIEYGASAGAGPGAYSPHHSNPGNCCVQ